MKRTPGQKQKGFTLIEMLVAVGLFTVVMTMSLGVIASIIDGNKKAQAINSVSTNLGFALESMVRDIKTGYNYRCDYSPTLNPDQMKLTVDTCVGSTPLKYINLISTISGAERGVRYQYWDPTPTSPGYISKESCTSTGDCTGGIAITSPEIDITSMSFYVQNPAIGVGQPGVFLIIRGTSKANPTQVSDFNLQTFISQRVLNI